MIVYVSPAELNGGILQFSTSIARETRVLQECKLFLPNVVDKKLYEDIADDVIEYTKIKTLRKKDEAILDIAKQIMRLSPDLVVFLEDSILMQQINEILYKKKIKSAMVIHDIQHHPYRKMGARKLLVDIIRRRMTKKTIKHCFKIILLSQNSEEAFRKEYKVNNTVVFRLPAHVPNTSPEIPNEIREMSPNYFLFFGRIDEYKGINTLCKAFSLLPDDFKSKNKLIIAGKGQFSNEEMELIQADKDIILIRRFIEDSEMVWLFQNTIAVVMPYIEASQSGVLPIAYKFGKPVVVSDLQGLTENVLKEKTGFVFKSIDDLSKILYRFEDKICDSKDILSFYSKNYLWENNLRKLIRVLLTERE